MSCSQTPPINVLALILHTKFHTHAKQQAIKRMPQIAWSSCSVLQAGLVSHPEDVGDMIL
jgi:hypothetical protein